MSDFTNKTVVITGASRGIGEATARLFYEHGANVCLLARSQSRISEIASDLGERAIAVTCDVAHYENVASAIQTCTDRFGGIDVLINNAGVLEPISRIVDANPEDWGRTVDVNLKGVFYGMHSVLPNMIKRGSGTILTISSGAAHSPLEAWSHYCAAKAGAAMMTSMLDLENRKDGIRAMGLSPGTVATQMQREIKSSGINPVSDLEWEDHVDPIWPAKALLWMCTEDSDDFLGQELHLRDPNVQKGIGRA